MTHDALQYLSKQLLLAAQKLHFVGLHVTLWVCMLRSLLHDDELYKHLHFLEALVTGSNTSLFLQEAACSICCMNARGTHKQAASL